MADGAERNLTDAVQGLLERSEALCNRSIAGDDDMDRLEVRVDAMGHDIILRYSPVASDLRQVISAIKVSAALERVSDHAVGIARRGRELSGRPPLEETEWLRPVCEHAALRLGRGVDAYFRGDVELAVKVAQGGDRRSPLYGEIRERLTSRLEKYPARARDLISLLLVVRMLKRIADHAENIAEDAIFLLTARDVRHGGGLASDRSA